MHASAYYLRTPHPLQDDPGRCQAAQSERLLRRVAGNMSLGKYAAEALTTTIAK